MSVDDLERTVGIAGIVGLAAAWIVATRAVLHHGRRPVGRGTGPARRLGAPAAYLMMAVPYFAVWVVLWHSLPGTPPTWVRVAAAVVGCALGASGLTLYLWGHLTLGRMYNVSSALGTELYADHQLVTSGPFRIVRHPMYSGIGLAALGGLVIYRTWAMVFAVASALGLAWKAGREERLLEDEFGEAWHEYTRRVPAWWPHSRAALRRAQPNTRRTS